MTAQLTDSTIQDTELVVKHMFQELRNWLYDPQYMTFLFPYLGRAEISYVGVKALIKAEIRKLRRHRQEGNFERAEISEDRLNKLLKARHIAYPLYQLQKERKRLAKEKHGENTAGNPQRQPTS